MANGYWPTRRHDGHVWTKGDIKRKKMQGKTLGYRAALCEVRGDWKFMKDVFCLPAWNEKSGCCWRCTCTPDGIRDVGLDAPWRQPANRLTHWDVIQRILEKGKRPSPLWNAPWVRSCIFKIDWLHAADHGVTSAFLPNAMLLIMTKLPGGNIKDRCANLWRRIQELYGTRGVEDRMTGLTPTMLQPKSKSPALRASAAQCRALVPVIHEMAQGILVDADPHEQACKVALGALHQCYMALSDGSIFWKEILEESSRRFAAQYVALEQTKKNAKHWRVKPKLHLFLELCSMGEKPSKFWAYRDEDFGGTCARFARRRGGLLKPNATSRTMLQKFMMKSKLPRIR